MCGGRDFGDQDVVWHALDQLRAAVGDVVVIEGGAAGADRLGREWAEARGAGCITYRAQWSRYGRDAGPIRNQQMLDEGRPDLVLAFPSPRRGLEGTGTGDMVSRARATDVEVRVVGLDESTGGLFE